MLSGRTTMNWVLLLPLGPWLVHSKAVVETCWLLSWADSTLLVDSQSWEPWWSKFLHGTHERKMNTEGCFVVEWGTRVWCQLKAGRSSLWHFRRHLGWERCLQLWDSNPSPLRNMILGGIVSWDKLYLKLTMIKKSIKSLKIDSSSGAKERR